MNLDRSQEKTAIVAAVLQGGIALVCFAFGQRHEPIFPTHFITQTGNILFISSLISFLSAFHAYLARLSQEEGTERERSKELEKGQLFEASLEEIGRYDRSLHQFEKLILPVILLIISCIETGLASWVLTLEMTHMHDTIPKDRSAMLSIASTMSGSAVILFFVSKYSSGLAFGNKKLYLRPLSGYTFYNSGACVLGCVASLLFYWSYTFGVSLLTWVSCISSLVLAAERLITWVIDLYRPKSKRIPGLSVYDSRFLGLFIQPQGILHGISELIEYQFGIQISEGFIYRCFTKVLIPYLLLQLITLNLLSCIVYIQPQEKALLEQWGSDSLKSLKPGMHLKLPWPVCRVYRMTTEKVRKVNIPRNLHKENEKKTKKVSLWQDGIFKKNLFLTAGSLYKDEKESTSNASSIAVNLAAVNATVHYKIVDIHKYYAMNNTPLELIRVLSLRELRKYMISNDFPFLLRSGFQHIGDKLATQIQIATDTHNLGIRIVNVTINNLQPPPEIVPSYREILKARQDRLKKRLEAEQYAVKVKAEADHEANRIVRTAESDTTLITNLAEVEKSNYHEQYTIYQEYPDLYKIRSTMDSLEKWLQDVRKIVATTGKAREVFNLDLKRTQPDLLSVPIE